MFWSIFNFYGKFIALYRGLITNALKIMRSGTAFYQCIFKLLNGGLGMGIFHFRLDQKISKIRG